MGEDEVMKVLASGKRKRTESPFIIIIDLCHFVSHRANRSSLFSVDRQGLEACYHQGTIT
jgi:hypothetical protein